MALSEFQIPGMLSSPGCAAAAAKLAGEKYELGDALVDMLHGAIGDVGSGMMQSDSVSTAIFGAIITAANESAQLANAKKCTDEFVEREFSPIRNWSERVEEIRAEPDQLLASCQQESRRASTLNQQLVSAGSRTRGLEKQLGDADQALARLERERRPIQWCSR